MNQLPIRGKKKKKEVSSKILSSPAFSPAGELYSIVKMDLAKTKTEKIPRTDALEMSAHGSRRLGGGRWCQLTPQPRALQLGYVTAQSLRQTQDACEGEGIKSRQKQQRTREEGRRKRKSKLGGPNTRDSPTTTAGRGAELSSGCQAPEPEQNTNEKPRSGDGGT